MTGDPLYTTYVAVLLLASLSVLTTLIGVALAIYLGKNERMIAVEMTEHDIGSSFQQLQDAAAHPLAYSHSYRMRMLAVAKIAERQPGINQNSAPIAIDRAAQAAYPQGLGADYFKRSAARVFHFPTYPRLG